MKTIGVLGGDGRKIGIYRPLTFCIEKSQSEEKKIKTMALML